MAYPGAYTFPGGKLEYNQTTEEALRDELMEEAELKMKPGKILLTDKAFVRPDGQTVKVFSYLYEVEDYSRVVISEDFTDYRWVNLDDLKDIPHVGIEGELRQADRLFSLDTPLENIQTESVRED